MKYIKGPAQGTEMLFTSDVRKLTGRDLAQLLQDTTFPRPRGGQQEDAYWAVDDLVSWATT